MLTDKRHAVALMILSFMLSLPALADTTQQQKMLDQLAQLDQLDHLDFLDKDAKANACIEARDFTCAEKNMAAAKRLAKNPQDKESLQMTHKNLDIEQELLASERRMQREREEAEEEEARAREQAVRAQQAAEEREEERQRLKYAALSAGFVLGGGNQLSPERQAELMSAIARDSQTEGGDVSNFQSAAQGISEQQQIQAQEQQSNIRAQQRELQQKQAQARVAAEQAQVRSRVQIASATKVTDVTPAATSQRMPQIVQYVPQNVKIPTWTESCPPGTTPARNPNGTTVTAGSGAGYCIKDDKANVQIAAAGDKANNSDNSTSTGSSKSSSDDESVQSGKNSGSSTTKNKKTKWGPVQLEALAVCRQSQKSQKWECNGALDTQIIVDEPTVQSALKRQHCEGGTLTAGTTMIKGLEWQVYQCGHALGPGDYDVAKRYNLVNPRRSYICEANFSQRCTNPYTGQDKG